MRVEGVGVDRRGADAALRATVHTGDLGPKGFDLECTWEGLSPDTELQIGDVLLAFLLLPAMAYNETLDLGPHAVSARLLDQMDELQKLFVRWSHGLSTIAVKAETRPPLARPDGTALFFSGGVDSWYSALTSQSEGTVPTHLLFLIGFDMTTDQVRRLAQAQEVASKAADRLGAKLVVSRSNVRELSNGLIDWRLYHGSYMTAVALGLGAEISQCLLPSDLSPGSVDTTWGTHPDINPLWATETLEFTHSGFEANRQEKIEVIAEDDLALRTLRVCWQPVDAYNCGRCPKCSLVMAILSLIGRLDDAKSFPDSVDLKGLASLDARFEISERRTVIQLLIPIAEAKGEMGLVHALKKTFRHKYLRADRYAGFVSKKLDGQTKPRAELNLMTPSKDQQRS